MKESPIFTRTYDLLLWLIPLTLKFPRRQRFVLAGAVQRSALRFQEQLIEAAQGGAPAAPLQVADGELQKLRTYVRLCRDMQLLSLGQYEHAARLLSELGRLLGGWRKKVQAPPARA